MTTLVYGPYPPSPGSDAADGLAMVRALVHDGEQVVTASPEPSAAHRHFDVGGGSGALALYRLSGSLSRAVIRLDAAGLQAASDVPRLRPARLVLGRALRRVGDTELHLRRVPGDVSRRWVADVAAAATTVVVQSEEERDALVSAGLRSEVVRVDGPTAGAGGQDRQTALPAWTATTLEGLQRDVRRRAAASRGEAAAPGRGARGLAAQPLREIPPLALTPIQSRKPGVIFVKRLIRRLVAWQLDPIIQHVNRVHRAAIAAVEQSADQPKAASTSARAVARKDRSEA